LFGLQTEAYRKILLQVFSRFVAFAYERQIWRELMKSKRFRFVLVAVALLSLIFSYTVAAWQQDLSTTPVRPVELARDNMIKSELGSLLRSFGVVVGKTSPETADHKRLTVRWQSSTNGAKAMRAEQHLAPGMLNLSNSATRAGAAPRPRNLELAATHMLVIAVDELQQLLWWNQFPDPRILRAEVPDANGQQHIGRTFYLTETEFAVAYPNNPATHELRFYHPLWTGTEFQLELIGSVSVK
jgi:hypothetical protein